MRPLFFDFWKDPGSETVDDEMMFGPDYLVAPQLIENATSRSVYLVRTTSDRFPFESSLYLSRACLDKPSLSSSELCTQQSRLRAQPPLPATVSRSVSASAGEELVETSYVWQNYFTKQEYNTSAGGIHITEETPLDTFPLYYKLMRRSS
jgi:hypothetical protein